MKGVSSRYHLCMAVTALAALGLAACDSSGATAPPEIATIEVTSPINTTIAVGRDAQLTAVARDAQGRELSPTFTWSSTNTAVATVSQAGLVGGVAAGNAVITAEAEGKAGSLAMRVVDADLSALASILTDPLRTHLTARLTSARTAVEAALTAADQALAAGNLIALNDALLEVRAQAGSATSADDRAILATLVLLTDFAVELLDL